MIVENIGYGYDYDIDGNTIIARDNIANYGLFSTFTLLLSAISKAHVKYDILLENLEISKVLKKFKSDESQDLYSMLFKQDKKVHVPKLQFGPNVHHDRYDEALINKVSPYIDRYLSPTDYILENKEQLVDKYELKTNDRISVIYRGSDKWTDMGGFIAVNPAAYIKAVQHIKQTHNVESSIIQSEESEVCKFFKQRFKSAYITETAIGPTTRTGQPIPTENKIEWLMNFISALYIHADSKYLVTYTGNTGFFITMLRKTPINVMQEKSHTFNIDNIFYDK